MKSPSVGLRSRKLRQRVMGRENKIKTKSSTPHKQMPERQQTVKFQLAKLRLKPGAKLGSS